MLKPDKEYWGQKVESWGNVKGIAIMEPKEDKMTTRDFCYWLQGFFELNDPKSLTEEQTMEVRKHLYNVFQHDCESIKLSPVTNEFYVEHAPHYGYPLNDVKEYDPAKDAVLKVKWPYGNTPASC